jgi:hypothetical protein
MVTKEMEEDRKKILKIQKDLFNEVMEYQMKYGSDSVTWNCSVNYAQCKN